jgi:hypothetical protein
MHIAFALLVLLLGSTVAGQPARPMYPSDFEVRGCSTIDGRDQAHPDQHCANCTWIRTDDGWMVSCQ